jgi:hypothetical protein
MASGMEMMMKSLGIDPNEIKASIESFKKVAETVQVTQAAIDAKLSSIEGKIDQLLVSEKGVDQSHLPNELLTQEAIASPLDFKTNVRDTR